MSNNTERKNPFLGNLIWEHTPRKSNINSLKRISLYILLVGVLSAGLLILNLWKTVELKDWGSFISKEFLSIVVFTAGMFITAWMIRNHAHQQKQSRWVLYVEGVQSEHGDQIHSGRYEDLKIWQTVLTVSVYGMTETTHRYLVQFPDGHEAQTIDQQTGDLLQEMMTRSQLPAVINAFQNSEQLDFSDLQLNAEGVGINNDWLRRSVWFPKFLSKRTNGQKKPHASRYKLIPWDRISSFKLNNGTLSVMGFNSRSIAARIPCSGISNLSVLLNLLQHLDYFQEESAAPLPVKSSKLVGILYIAAGIMLAIPGNYWIYHYIQDLEMVGGRVRMNSILAFMYLIFGKSGIVTLILLIAIYWIYEGFKEIYSQQ
jgi:hypothetical protein